MILWDWAPLYSPKKNSKLKNNNNEIKIMVVNGDHMPENCLCGCESTTALIGSKVADLGCTVMTTPPLPPPPGNGHISLNLQFCGVFGLDFLGKIQGLGSPC